jgi:hypothetical protein
MARLTEFPRCAAATYSVTARFCTRCGANLEMAGRRWRLVALKAALWAWRQRRGRAR